MTSTTVPTGFTGRSPVLADLAAHRIALPKVATDALLVLTGTLFVALLAQVVIYLPFTPVPLTLSTFAVVLTGASLGTARGGLSLALYVFAGMLGAPLFGEASSGWAFASFGYILAYVPMAMLAGYLARRQHDRKLLTTAGLVAGSLALVYLGGTPWLMTFLNVDLPTALSLGVTPFLLGDALKGIVICALLPTAWKLVNRVH
jgi:biotin transport system substrate-specific component